MLTLCAYSAIIMSRKAGGNMYSINATTARKEWSAVVDTVIREKPLFIKRTRDLMVLAKLDTFEALLDAYTFHADVFVESNGSVTMSLKEIDIAENGADKNEARHKLANAILKYAEEYYGDFVYWARGDRKSHIPYVFKVLILNDPKKIEELIKCRNVESKKRP